MIKVNCTLQGEDTTCICNILMHRYGDLVRQNVYGTIQIVAAALNVKKWDTSKCFIFRTASPTIRTENTDQLCVSLLAH